MDPLEPFGAFGQSQPFLRELFEVGFGESIRRARGLALRLESTSTILIYGHLLA